jgi:hypothetical protein
MRTARTVVCMLRLVSTAASVAAPLSVLLGAGAMLVACDDDNDPKTWVKRLDDPAMRTKAISRLTQFYEDGMTKAGNDAGSPDIKSLLDTIVEPMAKTYTAGGLDDKTRVDLMKFLAETHDPRTQPAIAKALKDFEMGKTDDETRVACDSINAMSKAGVKLDQTVIDELWNVFARFQISKAKSERLYHAVQDAVLQVEDPSYAEKAMDKLKGTVPPNPSVDIQQDQLMWWQLTSVRILSELKYTKAVKPLIIALLTPTKTSTLGATIQFALLKMAKASEPELIKCLNGGGGDADYTNVIKMWGDDKSWIGVTSEVLAVIGRAPGRDAILAALPSADNDTARTELAQALTQMPGDPRMEPAFLDAYKKLTWDSSDTLLGQLKPRIALAQQSAKFYDPKLVPWLLKEMKGAPDYSAKIIQVEAEAKLMTPDLQDDVAAVLATLKKETPADGFAKVQQMFDATSAPLLKCKQDVSCYLAVLEEPIPAVPATSYYKQVKASWMTVIYGSGNANATRAELLKRVDKVQNTGARIAVCEAIDELAPQGDPAAADALEKIVANDVKSGNKEVVAADNTVAQVAWRLRVRGQ